MAQNPIKSRQTRDNILNDYLNSKILGKSNKTTLLPKQNDSAFGNFSKEYKIKKKPDEEFKIATYEKSHAATASNMLVVKGTGTGGKTSSKQKKKEVIKKPAPKAGAFQYRRVAETTFRKYYDRGDLPIKKDGPNVDFTEDLNKLNYNHYLPMFVEGLRETQEPYRSIAQDGATKMVEAGGQKVFHVIPQLIIPIKTALNTRHPDVIIATLKFLQKLVTCGDMVGEMLVPYYRQILPIFNIFKNKNLNSGDKMDMSQRKAANIGDLINETLELFEQTGGEDAFINIKYMVPTYESCMLN